MTTNISVISGRLKDDNERLCLDVSRATILSQAVCV